jgi:glycerophosphoryl diester phosphodiesterase
MKLEKTLTLLKIWFLEYFGTCKPINKKYIDYEQIFLIIGHRGSPAEEPENTIISFEKAIEQGANAIETDLCITKDNRVVLWHDWDPNETNSILRQARLEPTLKYRPHVPSISNPFRKKTSELTLDEFKSNYSYIQKDMKEFSINIEIPTLNKFFDWANEKQNLKAVFLDIKTPPNEKEFALKIIEQIKSLIDKKTPHFKIIIETFYVHVLIEMKKNFPELNYSLDIEPRFGFVLNPIVYSSARYAIKYHNAYAIPLKPREITIANWVTYRRIVKYDMKRKYRYNKKNSAKKIHAVIGCVINKKEEMDCLIKMGISGIQTDYPKLLYEAALKHAKKLS